jgi:hypothetical protein
MIFLKTAWCATCIGAILTCTPPPKAPLTVPSTLPLLAPAADSLSPLASVVNIPIRMRTSVIEEMLNRQLAGLLYECDTLTLGSFKPVKLKVWKGDSIKIALVGSTLHYKVPLRLWMQFECTVGALGLSHTEYQDVEAALTLKFTSRITIRNNWEITTTTASEGYDWISDPVIKVRILTIPIRPIADLVLSNQKKNLSDLIDNQAAKAFNVKNILLPLWSQLQDPLLISKDPKVWLTISPQEIYMSPLFGHDGAIVSSVGLKSVIATFFADQPNVKKRDSLPDFIPPASADSSFVLNLYSEMNFEAATVLLQELLQGRQFKSGNKEIVIKDVSMTGVNGYALLCFDLTGSYQGRIFAYGRPRFDTLSSTVSIEDLDFELSTKNLLHTTANWIIHGMILSGIKPYLKFPLREKLLESQLMVQKMLCHSELSKNIFILGSIDSLKVAGVRLTDSAIRVMVFAKGRMQLDAHE